MLNREGGREGLMVEPGVNPEVVSQTQETERQKEGQVSNENERESMLKYLLASKAVQKDLKDNLNQLTDNEIAAEYAAALEIDHLANEPVAPVIQRETEKVEEQVTDPKLDAIVEKIEENHVNPNSEAAPEEKSEDQGGNKPRTSYKKPIDYKEQMKALKDQVVEGWEAVEAIDKQIVEKYQSQAIVGRGMTAAENEEAFKKLASLLEEFPAARGNRFYPGGYNQMGVDKVIFNHNAPVEELRDFFELRFSNANQEDQDKEEKSLIKHGSEELQAPNSTDLVKSEGLVKRRFRGKALPGQSMFDENDPDQVRRFNAAKEVKGVVIDNKAETANDDPEKFVTSYTVDPKNRESRQDIVLGDEGLDAFRSETDVIDKEPVDLEIKPEVIKDLAERLADSRKEYSKAKKAIDSYTRAKKLHKYSEAEKSNLQKAFEMARTDYEKNRALYIGTTTEKYQQENKALRRSHLEEYGDLDPKFYNSLRRFNTKLGEMSLYNLLKKAGKDVDSSKVTKFLTKSVNARGLLGLGILGVGYASGAMVSAGIARFAFRSATSGVGFREWFESIRKSKLSYKPYSSEQIQSLDSLDLVELRMAQIESQMFLDGKNEAEIEADPEYGLLTLKQQELLRDLESNPKAESLFKERFNFAESDFDRIREQEKKARNKTLVAGAVAGLGFTGAATAIFGGGKDTEAIESKASGISSSETVNRPGGETPVTGSKGPEVEASATTEIKAGRRGIEGALIDLGKSADATDKSMYQRMMEKLHQEFSGSKNSDAELIHKKIVALAKEKGFTVDGGGNDLSRITEGGVKLNADGSISLDVEKGDFIDAGQAKNIIEEAVDAVNEKVTRAVDNIAAEKNPEIPKYGSEYLKNESLDFSKIGQQVNASELAENALENVADQKIETFDKFSKVSDALKEIYPKNEYNSFMKEAVGISTRELNKMQNISVSEFMRSYRSEQLPIKQVREFAPLMKTLENYLLENPIKGIAVRNESIRHLLIRIALERTQK